MKRRHFVHSAAVCTGLALSNSLTAATTQKRRVKYGQVGTEHAHAAGQMQTVQNLTDDYEIVGLAQAVDNVAQRKPYADVPRLSVEELLSSDVDVIAVETSPRDSLAVAQRCIAAGKHIHLDKPAGESLPDLERLHKTADERSLTIQMGYMYRYNHAFKFMFDAVKNGWLGDIFEVHTVMSKSVNDSARESLAEYPGGSMFELGCHLIDPLIHMLGPPDNVIALNRKTRDDTLLDNTFAVFEYPRATAHVRSTLVEVDGFRRRQFVACGTQGTIVIKPLDNPTLELTLSAPQENYRKGTQMVELPKSKGRYHGAWLELAQVIRGERKLPFSHEHDVAVQRAILSASGLMEWK